MMFSEVVLPLFLHVLLKALEGAVALPGLPVEWRIALITVRFPVVLNGFRFRITHGNPSCVAALKGAETLWDD